MNIEIAKGKHQGNSLTIFLQMEHYSNNIGGQKAVVQRTENMSEMSYRPTASQNSVPNEQSLPMSHDQNKKENFIDINTNKKQRKVKHTDRQPLKTVQTPPLRQTCLPSYDAYKRKPREERAKYPRRHSPSSTSLLPRKLSSQPEFCPLNDAEGQPLVLSNQSVSSLGSDDSDQHAVNNKNKPPRKTVHLFDNGTDNHSMIPVTPPDSWVENDPNLANIQGSEPGSEGIPRLTSSSGQTTCNESIQQNLKVGNTQSRKRRYSSDTAAEISPANLLNVQESKLSDESTHHEDTSQKLCVNKCVPEEMPGVSQCCSDESHQLRSLISSPDQTSTTSAQQMISDVPPTKKVCLSDNESAILSGTEVGTSQTSANLPYVQNSELFNTDNENIPHGDGTQQVQGHYSPPSLTEILPSDKDHSGGELRQLKFKRTHSNTPILSVQREDSDDVHSRASDSCNKLQSPKSKFGPPGHRRPNGKRLKRSPKIVAKKKSAKTVQLTLHRALLTQKLSSTSLNFVSPDTTSSNTVTNTTSTSEAAFSNPSRTSIHTSSPTTPAPPPVSSCHSTNSKSDVYTQNMTESSNSSFQPSTKKKRRKRCGRCSSCSTPDCGKCANCLDKRGPKKRKQACQEKPMCIQWKESEYEEAIRLGHIVIEATKLTFSGVPGSGKSTLRSLILNEILPSKRNSTPVATKATQATIVALDQEQWHKVNREEIMEMIMDQLEDKRYEKEQTPEDNVHSVPPNGINDECNHIGKGASNENKRPSLWQRFRAILNDHQQRRRKGKKLQLNKMIYLVDIGGQPQLQEVVPLVVRNASVNLLVHKLSDELSAKPKNEIYNDGKCMTEPEEMDITNEEYLENAARSVFLSKPKLNIKQAISVPDKPSVVLVGTHKDQEHKYETLEEKEELLKDKPIFKHHLKENHIKCIRGKLILDIDGSESGYASEENIAKLKKLRNALLTHGSKLKVKVPIAWYLLLLNIQTESDIRDFISLEECHELGGNWEISNESVDAALQFFDELNLILYFPSSCPSVVFCNPDFLLQKLTDMILTGVTALDVDDQPGSRRIFKEQGIFTRELFETSTFQEGFDHLFSLDDFLLLLQDLPIIAKISIDKDKEKYFMPCALSLKHSSDFPGSPASKYPVDPLIIIFPKGCSPTGLFCATIVHLIQSHRESDDLSKFKWIIAPSENLKRKRNVIEFQICDTSSSRPHYDDTLGTVILEDASDSFIVRTTVDPEYCHDLCNVLNSVLETAIEELSYSADRIDFVLGVQCTMCTGKKAHFSSIRPDNTWRCANNYGKKPLTSRQRPWFEEQMEIGEYGITEQNDTDGLTSLSLNGQPKIHEFERLTISNDCPLKIIESTAPKWEKVAYALKFSHSIIEIIKRDYTSKCEGACQNMLQRWLNGAEDTLRPITWRSVIKVLEESNNSELASKLSSAICR